MRRFVSLVVAGLIGGGVFTAGVAFGGAPVFSPGGEFSVLDVDVIAGKGKAARKAHSVGLQFHAFTGKTDGSRQRDSGLQIRLDKSLRFHADRFPSCDRIALEQQGPSACPEGSQVGTGTATADLRPGGPAELPATLTLFNGAPEAAFPSQGDPLLLAYAIPEGATTGVVFYFVQRTVSGGPYRTVLDGGVAPGPGDPDSLFILTRFDVETPSKTIKVKKGKKGKKKPVAYIEARKCSGGVRRFEMEELLRGGESLLATDVSGCTL